MEELCYILSDSKLTLFVQLCCTFRKFRMTTTTLTAFSTVSYRLCVRLELGILHSISLVM